MSNIEEENELQEMMNTSEEEIITRTNWKRCTNGRRQMFGHDPGRGSNCKMNPLNDDDLVIHDRRILLKRHEKVRRGSNDDLEPVDHSSRNTSHESRSESSRNTSEESSQQSSSNTFQEPQNPSSANATGGQNNGMFTPNMFQNPMFMMNMDPNQANQNMMFNPMMMMMMNSGMMMSQNMKVPVPEWNKELSFDAWKRNLESWSKEAMMTPGQKINLVVESLKKNSERSELKSWVIQDIEEDEKFDRNNQDSVRKLLEKMESKFKISSWKKAGTFWKEILHFKQEDGETAKKYLERFNLMETKLKNSNCKISNILLAQHFLQKSNLNSISIQNILSKVNTEDEEKVL